MTQYLQYIFHCVRPSCSEFLRKYSCQGTRHTDCSRKPVSTSETPHLVNIYIYFSITQYFKNHFQTSFASDSCLVLNILDLSLRDNQLNLEDGRRHRQERPLLLPSAFDNGLADRKSAFKRLNGSIQATSCTYLVNVCPIISEFMLLKCTIFATIRPQFDDYLYSSPWHSEMDWKITILISAE